VGKHIIQLINKMKKKYFALYLLPPRPDFAQTMTEEERATMMNHVAYWTDLMSKGLVVAFGPVFDPAGVYGLGIVCVTSDDQLYSLMENDPANGLNRYEAHPMNAVVPGF
jgi:hypothetical protein